MRVGIGILALTALVVGGCNSSPTRDAFSSLINRSHAKNSPLRQASDRTQNVASAYQSSAGFSGAKYVGTGAFVSQGRTSTSVTADATGNGYELNLVNAPIAEAAKAVLGDALRASYVVDPRVAGTVTLQTSKPVGRDALVDILESALAVNRATIIKSGGSFKVIPIGDALSSTPTVRAGGTGPGGPGIQVQVIELQYIAADEMKTLLEPMSRQGSILRTDATRNLIVIAGNGKDIAAMREAVSVFDVDWMRGMSVALHPLKTSDPAAVSKELETIFATNDGPGAKLIKFVPNKRLNAVLVITSRPAYPRMGEAGFTLVEMLVVLAVIGLVAGLVAPQIMRYLGTARVDTTNAQIRNIVSALDLYFIDNGGYPSQEQGLSALAVAPADAVRWNGPYLKGADKLADPWGNVYVYAVSDAGVSITSLGGDGKPPP